MALMRFETVSLPRHAAGGFDHGDVHLRTGRVFVAHTATGSVEIIEAERARHIATVPGCPEASGVLCAQDEGLVLAAARGAGSLLVMDAASGKILGDVVVGSKPNGLAWDRRRQRALVADVQDYRARVVDVRGCRVVSEAQLPGRPRWCVYDEHADRHLVNIQNPACVMLLAAASLDEQGRWPVSAAGPHGLDLDLERRRAFVACDGGVVAALDLESGRELATVELAGEPDVIWHNPDHNRLYVAIGRPGVVDVIDAGTMRRVEQVVTEQGAHTTAFDRTRQRLYVFLPQSCCAAVYEENSGRDAGEAGRARRGRAS